MPPQNMPVPESSVGTAVSSVVAVSLLAESSTGFAVSGAAESFGVAPVSEADVSLPESTGVTVPSSALEPEHATSKMGRASKGRMTR
jgi:hypothetical protein